MPDNVTKLTEPPKAEAPPKVETERTFSLTRPVTIINGQGQQEKIMSLTLRYPTGADMIELPMPYDTISTNKGVEVRFNGAAVRDWIVRLNANKAMSGSDIANMTGRDFRAIYDWLCTETNPGN